MTKDMARQAKDMAKQAKQAAQRPMAQQTVISSRHPRQLQASLLHSRRRQP